MYIGVSSRCIEKQQQHSGRTSHEQQEPEVYQRQADDGADRPHTQGLVDGKPIVHFAFKGNVEWASRLQKAHLLNVNWQ